MMLNISQVISVPESILSQSYHSLRRTCMLIENKMDTFVAGFQPSFLGTVRSICEVVGQKTPEISWYADITKLSLSGFPTRMNWLVHIYQEHYSNIFAQQIAFYLDHTGMALHISLHHDVQSDWHAASIHETPKSYCYVQHQSYMY